MAFESRGILTLHFPADIDRQAQERFERLIEDIKQVKGITDSKRSGMDRKNKECTSICDGNCRTGNYLRTSNGKRQGANLVVFMWM